MRLNRRCLRRVMVMQICKVQILARINRKERVEDD